MKAFSHIVKKYHLLLDVKITAYWLLVKKRINLVQIAQELVQFAQVLIWRSKH